MADFGKFLANALVILVGWIVVHKLSIKRDRDKSRRDMVAKFTDDATRELDELLITSLTYHCSDRDVSKERKLKMKLQDLAQGVAGLSMICEDKVNLSRCKSSVRKLREAITGQHFEDEHLTRTLEGSELLENIAAETLNAKRVLMMLKHAQYPAISRSVS